MNRRRQFDISYMKMALAFAELSRARRNKVGAIIVNEDDQVIAQGFNGTPSGFDNNCEDDWCDAYNKLADPINCNYNKAKRTDSGWYACKGCEFNRLKTKKEVLHAESNAIMKCARNGHSTKGATIYVTLSPCIDCAKLIVQADIKRVVYLEKYDKNEGLDLLEKANIIVEQIQVDNQPPTN